MNLQWKAASGFVQGIGHQEMNEPCQDRTIHFHDKDLHGIVLADGAGSCRFGGEGAELIVQTIMNSATEKFDEWYESEKTAIEIEEFLLQYIDEEVQQYDFAERMDFSCTLLFVLIKKDRYLAGHIGDGVIFQRVNNNLSVLSYPENGRYKNETYFVTMAPLNEHFRIYKGELNTHTDFMLLSDGAATSFYLYDDKEIEEKNTAVIFNHLVENDENVVNEEILDLLGIIRENTTDDCAISLIVSHTVDMIVPFEVDNVEIEKLELPVVDQLPIIDDTVVTPSTAPTPKAQSLINMDTANDNSISNLDNYNIKLQNELNFEEEDELEIELNEIEEDNDYTDYEVNEDDYLFQFEEEEYEVEGDILSGEIEEQSFDYEEEPNSSEHHEEKDSLFIAEAQQLDEVRKEDDIYQDSVVEEESLIKTTEKEYDVVDNHSVEKAGHQLIHDEESKLTDPQNENEELFHSTDEQQLDEVHIFSDNYLETEDGEESVVGSIKEEITTDDNYSSEENEELQLIDEEKISLLESQSESVETFHLSFEQQLEEGNEVHKDVIEVLKQQENFNREEIKQGGVTSDDKERDKSIYFID